MMSKQRIRETVLRILGTIAPEVKSSGIDPDVSFHDQFEIDSIDFLQLMMTLEKDLNVPIADIDYPKLSTLNGCETYLADRLAT